MTCDYGNTISSKRLYFNIQGKAVMVTVKMSRSLVLQGKSISQFIFEQLLNSQFCAI